MRTIAVSRTKLNQVSPHLRWPGGGLHRDGGFVRCAFGARVAGPCAIVQDSDRWGFDTGFMKIELNGHPVDVPPAYRDDTLLWLLREGLGQVGTRHGCGVGTCGACTVLVDGQARWACVTPVSGVLDRRITTIEGLGRPGQLHALQQAWLAVQVPQCGYCQAGQIMAAAALLAAHPRPSEAQIDEAMAPQLCRCGTQGRIRAAIALAVERPGQGA